VLSCRVEDVVQLRLVTSLPHACTPPEPHLTRNIFHFLGQTRLAKVQGCLPATNGTTANQTPHSAPALGATLSALAAAATVQPRPLSVQTLPQQPAEHARSLRAVRYPAAWARALRRTAFVKWGMADDIDREHRSAGCSALELKNKGTFVSTSCVHPVSAGVSYINVDKLGLGVKVGSVLVATTGIRNFAGIAGADSRR
jgi:hypothetical protein